jgi:hypothetical protein
MNSRVALFAINIALVLLLGTAITSFSNNTFSQTPQTGEETTFQVQSPGFESSPSELTLDGNFSESPSDLDSSLTHTTS